MPYQSVFRPELFKGQTIIVTGGGSGIGRCTAHELSSLGAHVAIAGRKLEKLDVVKAEIEAAGGTCETHAFDIREEAQVKEAVVKAAGGRLWSNLRIAVRSRDVVSCAGRTVAAFWQGRAAVSPLFPARIAFRYATRVRSAAASRN